MSAARRILYAKIDKLATTANVKIAQQSLEESQERKSQLGKLTANIVLTGDTATSGGSSTIWKRRPSSCSSRTSRSPKGPSATVA